MCANGDLSTNSPITSCCPARFYCCRVLVCEFCTPIIPWRVHLKLLYKCHSVIWKDPCLLAMDGYGSLETWDCNNIVAKLLQDLILYFDVHHFFCSQLSSFQNGDHRFLVVVYSCMLGPVFT